MAASRATSTSRRGSGRSTHQRCSGEVLGDERRDVNRLRRRGDERGEGRGRDDVSSGRSAGRASWTVVVGSSYKRSSVMRLTVAVPAATGSLRRSACRSAELEQHDVGDQRAVDVPVHVTVDGCPGRCVARAFSSALGASVCLDVRVGVRGHAAERENANAIAYGLGAEIVVTVTGRATGCPARASAASRSSPNPVGLRWPARRAR